MKNIYWILFIGSISNIGFGQESVTDDFKYKATYELTWQIDSTDTESIQHETMVLFIGDQISRFSSEGHHISDSIQHVYKNRERTPQSFSEMRSKMPETEFKYYIDKNLASRELNFKEKIVKDYYKYAEDLSGMEWEILQDTGKIAGFSVQKAKTSFAGRNYSAWFSLEIPIPDGPYKFNGLPGLILKIADEEEYYVFELIGFKSLKNQIFNTESGEEYLETGKNKFREIKKEYEGNPFAALERGGITFGFEPGQKEKMMKEHKLTLQKQNNPIELEEKR